MHTWGIIRQSTNMADWIWLVFSYFSTYVAHNKRPPIERLLGANFWVEMFLVSIMRGKFERQVSLFCFWMLSWKNNLVFGDVKRVSVLGCPYNGWNFSPGYSWTVGIFTNGVNCSVSNLLGRSPVLQNLFIVVHQLPQMYQVFSFNWND